MTLRRAYGAGPLHLIGTLAALAVAGYALTRIFAGAHADDVALWLAGAVVAHDAIAFWLYTAADRVARAGFPRAAINHVRVPAILSGLAFVVFFPLILGLAPLERATTRSPDVYLVRWLALSAALFLGSALLYARRARRG